MTGPDAFETRIDEAAALAPQKAARALLALGELVMEQWVERRGETPTTAQKEGFRLLALHRQGASGDPSFNACRESCRELAFRYNVAMAGETSDADRARAVAMMASLARHLYYFVSGKMEDAGLGEFCCSSRPLRLDSDQIA